MKLRIFELIVWVILSTQLGFAQTKTIQGRVTHAQSKEPIVGAKVYLKAYPNQASITQDDGSFTLELPEEAFASSQVKIYIAPKDSQLAFPILLNAHQLDNYLNLPIKLPKSYTPPAVKPSLDPDDEDADAPEVLEPKTGSNAEQMVKSEPSRSAPEKKLRELGELLETPQIDQIEKALQKIKTHLTSERETLIASNQRIRNEIQSIFKELKDKEEISEEEKQGWIEKMEALEDKIRENTLIYQKLQENAQLEIDKVWQTLLGSDSFLYFYKIYEQTIIVLLVIIAALVIAAFLSYWIIRRLSQQKNRLQLLSQQLKDSLSQKEVLLKEIHHRVKNNLQIVYSLLDLQADLISDPLALKAIKNGQERIYSMALIHEKLYESENLDEINFQDYLEKLIQSLAYAYDSDEKKINFHVEAKQTFYNIGKALNVGLIINELVSNAFKYAFRDKSEGNIWVILQAADQERYQLRVRDDGQGLPTHFDLQMADTLGLKIVHWLTRQLRGDLQVVKSPGAEFIIHF